MKNLVIFSFLLIYTFYGLFAFAKHNKNNIEEPDLVTKNNAETLDISDIVRSDFCSKQHLPSQFVGPDTPWPFIVKPDWIALATDLDLDLNKNFQNFLEFNETPAMNMNGVYEYEYAEDIWIEAGYVKAPKKLVVETSDDFYDDFKTVNSGFKLSFILSEGENNQTVYSSSDLINKEKFARIMNWYSGFDRPFRENEEGCLYSLYSLDEQGSYFIMESEKDGSRQKVLSRLVYVNFSDEKTFLGLSVLSMEDNRLKQENFLFYPSWLLN